MFGRRGGGSETRRKEDTRNSLLCPVVPVGDRDGDRTLSLSSYLPQSGTVERGTWTSGRPLDGGVGSEMSFPIIPSPSLNSPGSSGPPRSPEETSVVSHVGTTSSGANRVPSGRPRTRSVVRTGGYPGPSRSHGRTRGPDGGRAVPSPGVPVALLTCSGERRVGETGPYNPHYLPSKVRPSLPPTLPSRMRQ